MITVKNASSISFENSQKDTTDFEFYGLSTDEKPTSTYEGRRIRNTSLFYEMNTKKAYLFDAENHQWLEQ